MFYRFIGTSSHKIVKGRIKLKYWTLWRDGGDEKGSWPYPEVRAVDVRNGRGEGGKGWKFGVTDRRDEARSFS